MEGIISTKRLYIQSHTRVCTMLVPPSFFKLKDAKKDNQVQTPKSLQDLCILAVRKMNIPYKGKIPDFLYTLIEESQQTECISVYSPRKSLYKIGNFGCYPDILMTPMPYLFTTDLISTANNVLRFLSEMDSIKELDNGQYYRDFVNPRYILFLMLQNSHSDVKLLPPLDVECVWFSHMLQSFNYREFILQLFPNLKNVSHTSILSMNDRAELLDVSKVIWNKFYPNYEYEFNPNRTYKIDDYGISINVDYRDLIDDRTWYKQFVRACQSAGEEDPTSILLEHGNNSQQNFFSNALLGYQRFLYLITKYPKYVEDIMFSPIPAIDLIWHTHLVQPSSYYYDAVHLMFQVRHHKILERRNRTERFYTERSNIEDELWNEEFGESMNKYLKIRT